MKLVSLKTAIELNNSGILDEIQTSFEYYHYGIRINIPNSVDVGIGISDETFKKDAEEFFKGDNKFKIIKTLTMDEAMEIIQDKKRQGVFSFIYSSFDGHWSCDAGDIRSGHLIEVVEAELLDLIS